MPSRAKFQNKTTLLRAFKIFVFLVFFFSCLPGHWQKPQTWTNPRFALINRIAKRGFRKAVLIWLGKNQIFWFVMAARFCFRWFCFFVWCRSGLNPWLARAGIKFVAADGRKRPRVYIWIGVAFVWSWPGHMIPTYKDLAPTACHRAAKGLDNSFFLCWIEVVEVVTQEVTTSITSYAKASKTLFFYFCCLRGRVRFIYTFLFVCGETW